MKLGDYGMSVSAFTPQHLEVEIDRAYRELGNVLASKLREGEIFAAQLIEDRDADLMSRRLVCSLHLKLRAVPEVNHNYVVRAASTIAPGQLLAASKPAAEKNVLRRLGRFIAETWEEAGETVRQCKAA